MTVPTTEAGRAVSHLAAIDYPISDEDILAIEAEATALEHARAVDACAKLIIHQRNAINIAIGILEHTSDRHAADARRELEAARIRR